MTETEFIDWLGAEKGIEINRKKAFSTCGSLGDFYMTKEGVNLFYGLSVKGYPPHLELLFVHTKHNHKIIPNKPETIPTYADKIRCFYKDKYTNEDRYKMLVYKDFLEVTIDN